MKSILPERDKLNTYQREKLIINESELDINFILTEEAEERLQKLNNLFISKIPVLLEGPTGTSKTKTIQVLCKLKKLDLIRFNLSSETTIDDLLGRIISDKDSWSGLKFLEGPFVDAYKNGKVFLLDEVNLAQKSLLQCIEASIINKNLNISTQGGTYLNYKMHENFRLVATRNPKTENYMFLRNDLTEKFLQKFVVITFPELQIDELKNIAKQMYINLKRKISGQNVFNNNEIEIIQNVGEFHYKWTKEPLSKNSIQCFTIRDIKMVIKSIVHGNSAYDAIQCFYGSRYNEKEKNILDEFLRKNFKNLYEEKEYSTIPLEFNNKIKNFYPSQTLKRLIYYSKFAVEEGKHLLITGEAGVGLTTIAKWLAKFYSKDYSCFSFYFTPETSVSDLIGRFIPNKNDNENVQNIIQWQNGPLIDAIKNGYSGIFVNLNMAQQKIIERLNPLFEPQDSEDDKYFYVHENYEIEKIEKHKNFLFVATCDINKIKNLSPALLNRLAVFVVDDQIENLNESELHYFIYKIVQQEIEINDENEEENNNENNNNENNENNEKNNENNEKNNENNENKNIINNIEEFIKEIILLHQKSKSQKLNSLSRLIKSSLRLYSKFPKSSISEIISYTSQLLNTTTTDITIPSAISDSFTEKSKKSIDEKFYYKNTKSLFNLMINLYSCSICNIPIILIGPTGLGKTSMAKAFSQLIRNSNEYYYYLFNSDTNFSDLFGTITFNQGECLSSNGPLYDSLLNGYIFIGDEFNLAEESLLQSMIIALDSNENDISIFIPGIMEEIYINKNFFFFGCQNDVKTIGRKSLPEIIKKRIRIFEYPFPSYEDIKINCLDITQNEIILINNDDNLITEGFALKLANFMNEINNKNLNEIGFWSMRDIRKIFRRVQYQQENKNEYLNVSPDIQIFIYILGGISFDKKEKIFKELIKIYMNIINSNKNEIDYIKNWFYDVPKITNINNINYLTKNNIGKKIPINISNLFNDLITLNEAFYYSLFCHFNESLLLTGPQEIKHFLAKMIEPSAKNEINFYQEITVQQLLGTVVLTNSIKAKNFILKLIVKICKKDEFYDELKKYIKFIPIKEKIDIKNTNSIRNSNSGNKKKKKKKFYKKTSTLNLENNILDLNDDDNNNNNNNDNNNNNENNNFLEFKTKIESLITNSSQTNPTIYKILTYLKTSLLSPIIKSNNNNNNNNLFNDFTSLFKPGLIIENILKQRPLILNNISLVSPSVLERFNDLLNFQPSIILNEDYCNTLTSANSKELNNFSSNFRIVALCEIEELFNLSEAFKSRMTVIYTEKLNENERYFFMKNRFKNFNKKFEEFVKNYENNFKYEFPFVLIDKIMEIFNRIIINNNDEFNNEKFLCLAIFKNVFPLLKINSEKEKILNIFKKVFNDCENYEFLKENSDYLNNEKLLKIDGNELISNITNLKITFISKEKTNEKNNISFVKFFNKILNSIHMSISLNFPLILEGNSGMGKKTAINYICEILGINVIYFTLSNSTTIENLFTKTTPIKNEENEFEIVEIKSKIYEIIENKNDENNNLIVFENLELASKNVLNIIAQIIDYRIKEILLPNGDSIIKGKFNIICTYDPTTNGISANNYLPQQIIYSSFLEEVSNYNKDDFKTIALNILNNNENENDDENDENNNNNIFNLEIEKFLKDFIKISNDSIKNQKNELFTLNDIKKFKLLRKASSNFLIDYELLIKFILIQKFNNINDIRNAVKLLKYSYENYWPTFEFKTINNENYFFAYPNNTNFDKFISIKIKKQIEKNSSLILLEKINTLSIEQRICLIFLILSIKSKIVANILQGKSLSGKTFIIKLLSEILGQDLIIFQLNNDSGLSLLTNQISPKFFIEKDAAEEIIYLLNQNLNNEIENLFKEINFDLNNFQSWKPNQLKIILSKIKEKNDKNFNELIKKISYQINFINHLTENNNNNLFINAMIEGKWILLDCIESAQNELYEKISSLCDIENSNINIFENGSEFIYSKKTTEKKRKIHKNFRLFITYNTEEIEKQKKLSPSFINKCLVYYLPEIDNNFNESVFIMNNLFKNEKFSFYEESFSIRITNVHFKAKEYSLKHFAYFSGKKSFSCYSLFFIFNVFKERKEKNLIEIIKSFIYDVYLNSYLGNFIEFKNILLDAFYNEISIEVLQYLRKDETEYEKKKRNVLNTIKNINENNENFNINFNIFFNDCGHFKINDIKELINEIEKIIKKINKKNEIFSYIVILNILLKKFLLVLNEISDEQKNEINNFCLNDFNLSDSDERFILPQRNFYLFENFLNDFNNKNPKIIFINEENYIKAVNVKKKKENIFFELINDKNNLIFNSSIIVLMFKNLVGKILGKIIINNKDEKKFVDYFNKYSMKINMDLINIMYNFFNYEEDSEENFNENNNENNENNLNDPEKIIIITKNIEKIIEIENFSNILENQSEKIIEKYKKFEDKTKLKDEIENNFLNIQKFTRYTIKSLNSISNKLTNSLLPIINYWEKSYQKFKNDFDKFYYSQTNQQQLECIKEFKKIIEEFENYIKNNNNNNNFLLNVLNKIKSSKNDTNEDLNRIKKEIQESIKISELNNNNNNNNNKIYFPGLISIKEDEIKLNDDQKFIQILIDYSQCIFFSNKIKDDENRIFYIKKLQDCNKDFPIDFIYNFLWTNLSNSNKIKNLISTFQFLCKSFVLKNIINNDYFLKFLNKKNLFDLFNNKIERNEISNDEIFYASFIAKKYEPNFEIFVLEFEPKDLFSQFVFFNEFLEEIDFSINLKTIFTYKNLPTKIKKQFLENLFEASKNEYLSYNNVLITIVKIFCNVILEFENINKTNEIEECFKNINLFKPFLENLKKEKYVLKNFKDFINYLIKLFDKLKTFDNNLNNENIKLNFSDLFFIKNPEWFKTKIESNSTIFNYPSLIYFLLKNPEIESQIRNNFKELDLNTKFPIYLIPFRYFSSLNCITFQNEENSYTSLFIKNKLSKKIIKKLKEKNKINFDWIGLLLPNEKIKINIINKEQINCFYNYLNNLCKCNFSNEEVENFNEFNNILNKLLNKIVEIVFNKSYNELFNFNINKIKNNIENFNIDNNNNVNDFILLTNIQFYFKNNIESEKKKINDELIKNFNKFEEETEKLLKNLYLNYGEDFNKKLKETIKEEILKEKNIQKNNKIETQKKNYENEISVFNNKKNIYLEKYNKILNKKKFKSTDFIQDYIEEILNIKEENENIKNSLNLNDFIQVSYFEIKNNNKKNEIIIKYKRNNKENEIKFTIKNKNKVFIPFYFDSIENIDKILINNKQFFLNEFKYENIQNLSEEKINKIISDLENKKKFLLEENLFNENFPIILISNQKISYSNIENDNFLNNIFDILNKFNFIVYNINDKNENENENKINSIIEYENNINEIYNLTKNICKFNLTNVKFENDSNFPEKTKIFFDKLNIFFSSEINKLEEIVKKYKLFKEKKRLLLNNLFTFLKKYEIFDKNLINENNKNIQIDFTKSKIISNDSPYITFSKENKLQFSLKTFTQKIGPLYSSLYNNKLFKYQFTSFVGEKIEISLLFSQENNLNKNFSIEKNENNFDFFYLVFQIKDEKINEKIESILKFRIKIKLNNDILLIPCIFYIRFLPIKFILNSDEYSFTYKNNFLVLNENKLRPEQRINFILNFINPIENINIYENIKSNDENEVKMSPKISKQNNIIIIEIPNEKEHVNKKFKGEFKFYLSPKFFIPIKINGIVFNCNYEFVSFNAFNNKTDMNFFNMFLYENDSNLIEDIELIFRVQFYDEKEHKIEIILPKIKQNKNDFHFELLNINNINTNIKNGLTFKIKVSNLLKNLILKSYEKNTIYYIKVKIDDEIKEKKLESKIYFKEFENNKNFNDSIYKTFENKTKIWKKISYSKLNNKQIKNSKDLFIFISPFSYLILGSKNIVNMLLFIEKNNFNYSHIEEFKNKFNSSENKKDFIALFGIKYINKNSYFIPLCDYFGEEKNEEFLNDEKKIEENVELFKNSYENEKKNEIFSFYFIFEFFMEENEKIENKIRIFEEILKHLNNNEKEEIKNELKKIDNENNENKNKLIFYNILFKFRKYLKTKKEKIIKNNGNLFLEEDFNEIKKKEFPIFNEEKFIQEILKHSLNEKNDEKNELKSSNKWLFIENSLPQKIDSQIEENILNEKIEFSPILNTSNSNLDYLNENLLNKIDLNKITNIENLNTIKNYLDLFKKLILLTQIFPIILPSLNDNEINKIFNFLYAIYSISLDFNFSLISNEINIFINNFEYLTLMLQKSNINLSKFEKIKKIDKISIQNTLISIPEKIKMNNINNWTGKNKKNSIIYDENFLKNLNLNLSKNNKINKKNYEKADDKLIAKLQLEEILSKNKVEKGLLEKFVKEKKKNYNLNKEIEEDFIENKNVEDDIKFHMKETGDVIKIRNKNNQFKNIETLKLIERQINLLKESNNTNLKINNNFSDELKKEDFKIFSENLINAQFLYKQSKNFTLKLFQQFLNDQNEFNFDLSNFYCCIAIDCSKTINEKNKLFHLIYSISLCNLFNILEIPFSIVIFADYKFQFEIKNFNENFSFLIIQKMLDSILINRYVTRIADVCCFINEKINHKNRIKKAVFIISNGLDVKLKKPNDWIKNIFNVNENTLFDFSFIKTDEINNDDYLKIEEIWKNFSKITKININILNIKEIIFPSKSQCLNILKIFNVLNKKETTKNEKKDEKIFYSPSYENYQKSNLNNLNILIKYIINKKIPNYSNKFYIKNKFSNSSKEIEISKIKLKNSYLTTKIETNKNEENLLKSLNLLINSDSFNFKQNLLNIIFPPNKPTTFSPSIKGSRLYILGIINFVLSQGQNNNIWLEKNSGLKRDYRITLIIDSSKSCFNEIMSSHSIQTIIILLKLFINLEIPFFDLIIATKNKPIVLCLAQDIKYLFYSLNTLWTPLLIALTHNKNECNLFSALEMVLNLNVMNSAKKHFCYVLTDGLIQNKTIEKKTCDLISMIEQSGIGIFGIGLGFYPKNISKLFSKCFWCPDPNDLLSAISVFFGNDLEFNDEIFEINFDIEENKKEEHFLNLNDKIEELIKNFDDQIVFKNLNKKLNNCTLYIEDLKELINENVVDDSTKINPDDKDTTTSMCKENQFKGLKVLICVFYDKTIAPEFESDFIKIENLTKRFDKNKRCLKEAFDYYGIKIEIVSNYKDSINKLKTGEFYACWILCGNGIKLPFDGNINLIYQFIECLEIFWKNGGALIWFCNNEPLLYELNIFLEKCKFPENKMQPVKFKFVGKHYSQSAILRGNINKNSKGIFDKTSIISDGKYERLFISHNLARINEGKTISYVNDPENIFPFKPFAYDNNNGLTIIYYLPSSEYKNGDIIIDGGFTKLFNELENEGTFRYIQNLIAYTTKFSKRQFENPNWLNNFHLDSFDYIINEDVKRDEKIIKITKEYDIVFFMDATRSMQQYIDACRKEIISISNELKQKYSDLDFNYGGVFYRDPVDSPTDKHEIFNLSKNVTDLENFLANVKAYGGGDGPEDWVGGIEKVLNEINWRKGTKLMIHIADAPAHGTNYCTAKKYTEEGEKLDNLIKIVAEQNIKIVSLVVNRYVERSFNRVKVMYEKNQGPMFMIMDFRNSKDIPNTFKNLIIESAQCAAPDFDKM